jgi:hypothetical protein
MHRQTAVVAVDRRPAARLSEISVVVRVGARRTALIHDAVAVVITPVADLCRARVNPWVVVVAVDILRVPVGVVVPTQRDCVNRGDCVVRDCHTEHGLARAVRHLNHERVGSHRDVIEDEDAIRRERRLEVPAGDIHQRALDGSGST